MTRQIPQSIAVPLGWVLFGAINSAMYGAGWVLMRIGDLSTARRRAWSRLVDEYRCRRVGAKAEQWLKDGSR